MEDDDYTIKLDTNIEVQTIVRNRFEEFEDLYHNDPFSHYYSVSSDEEQVETESSQASGELRDLDNVASAGSDVSENYASAVSDISAESTDSMAVDVPVHEVMKAQAAASKESSKDDPFTSDSRLKFVNCKELIVFLIDMSSDMEKMPYIIADDPVQVSRVLIYIRTTFMQAAFMQKQEDWLWLKWGIAIKSLYERCHPKWVYAHMYAFLKAFLFVMMDLTGEVSSGAVDMAKSNLETMLSTYCKPCESGDESLVEAQLKAINDVVQELVRQLTQPNNCVREQRSVWKCELCALDFTSQIPYDMHLGGARHAKKLKAKEALSTVQSQGTIPTAQGPDGEKAFFCELCNVKANSLLQLQTQLDGNKHKNKLQPQDQTEETKEKETASVNGKTNGSLTRSLPSEFGEPQPAKLTKYACDVCGITVNSEIQLQQHMSSKKHQNKVEGKPVVKGKMNQRTH